MVWPHFAACSLSEEFGTYFTSSDVGKSVTIEGDNVTINGVRRFVPWEGAQHHDCMGKITISSKDFVHLDNGDKFENVKSYIKGVGRIRPCPTCVGCVIPHVRAMSMHGHAVSRWSHVHAWTCGLHIVYLIHITCKYSKSLCLQAPSSMPHLGSTTTNLEL